MKWNIKRACNFDFVQMAMILSSLVRVMDVLHLLVGLEESSYRLLPLPPHTEHIELSYTGYALLLILNVFVGVATCIASTNAMHQSI